MLISVSCFSQETSTFTDSRDGMTYNVATYSIPLVGGVSVKRTWMTQNLNYEVEGSYCYQNEPAYCEAYGRMYTFQAASGACPEGWSLPTVKDWQLLVSKYGGMQKSGSHLLVGGSSGMNMLLGGFGDPGDVFKNVGLSGNYWDAESKGSNAAGLITVQEDSDVVYHGLIGSWHRNSTRCIKDY